MPKQAKDSGPLYRYKGPALKKPPYSRKESTSVDLSDPLPNTKSNFRKKGDKKK